MKEAKVKVPPEILTELAVLKTCVASLKNLSTEIAQIKDSLQQPRSQPQLYTLPSVEIPSQSFHNLIIIMTTASPNHPLPKYSTLVHLTPTGLLMPYEDILSASRLQ